MDHTPITIERFGGDYFRDEDEDCPFDHFPISQNIKYDDKGVRSRDGLVLNNAFLAVQAHLYAPATGSSLDRWIFLNTTGANADFFDSGVSLVTPILSLSKVNVNNFSMINLYGRAYIYPFNTLNVGNMYVYDPTKSATARLAGGTKPATSVTVAASATAGNVEVGVHLFSVSYETDSGFITPPAVATAFTVAVANFKIDLTNIPTGPAGTAKRQILATKRIVGYTGNPLDYELFFVPGGEMVGNVATTLTVNFFDADLVDSADYLLDEFENPPTGIGFCDYEGSLITWKGDTLLSAKGIPTTIIRISKFGQPESFSQVDGFSSVDVNDNQIVKNCFSLNKILYVLKNDRTYGIQGDLTGTISPSSWPVTKIDSGRGCTSLWGVARVLDTSGPNQDFAIIASKTGLEIFNGSYGSQPLSYKNSNDWDDLAVTQFFPSVFCDPVKKLIYVMGLSLTDSLVRLYVFDYQKGLNPEDVRATKWKFATSPFWIGLNIGSSGRPVLNVGLAAGWCKQSVNERNDLGAAIESYIVLAYQRDPIGGISHFNMFRSRLSGAGSFTILLFGFAGSVTIPPITLATSPFLEQQQIFNYNSPAMGMKMGTNAIDAWFILLLPLKIFVKPLWASQSG